MKSFQTALLLTIAFAISLPASAATARKRKGKPLSWVRFDSACGVGKENRQKMFEKVEGARVMWIGEVAAVDQDSALINRFTPTVIRVKMKPSPGFSRADITLRFPAAQAERVAKVQEGMRIKFIGKIAYLGTRLSDHIVEVEQFGSPKKGE